jgi:hypothetical protein
MPTNTTSYRMLGLIASCLLLPACDGPKSSSTSGPDGGPVPTGRITINLSVESTDQGPAVVRANLNDGRSGGASYRLDGGDFLRACVGGVCRSMADNDSIFTPDYIARFDYQGGVDYVVSFNREEAKDAPDSRVRLPPAFSIVTPVNHQPVTDGDTVLVSWSPTGAPARASLSYAADCNSTAASHITSSGSLGNDSGSNGRANVSINSIVNPVKASSTSPITDCRIDVKVSHELQGRIDPAFDDGSAVGRVSRVINLDYTAP